MEISVTTAQAHTLKGNRHLAKQGDGVLVGVDVVATDDLAHGHGGDADAIGDTHVTLAGDGPLATLITRQKTALILNFKDLVLIILSLIPKELLMSLCIMKSAVMGM